MLSQNIVSQAPPLMLAASYIALWLLERPDALRLQVKGRKLRNMLVASLAFAASGIGAAVVTVVAEATTRNRWGALWLIGAPDIVRILLGVLVIDVVDYWRHRVSHKLPLLWRLHRLHHTDLVMDVTTSLRSHPIEMLLRGAILAAATLALGIPVWSHLIYALVALPVLVFQHAAVRLPPTVERPLRLLLVTPQMHLVHHSRERLETDSNYSTFLSLWDRVFGTYRNAAPVALGLNGYDTRSSQTVIGMIATPWRDPVETGSSQTSSL